MFLASVGFWNFLGAGIFGFLINLPIVSYYEIGTALTANHGHAAMMGVYGMLAAGSGALLPALPDPGRALVRPGRAASASGRSTSGWPGCASRRCFRSGSCSSTSRSATATSRRATQFLTRDERADRVAAPSGDVVFIVGGCCRCSICAGWASATGSAKSPLEEPEHPLVHRDRHHRCHGPMMLPICLSRSTRKSGSGQDMRSLLVARRLRPGVARLAGPTGEERRTNSAGSSITATSTSGSVRLGQDSC